MIYITLTIGRESGTRTHPTQARNSTHTHTNYMVAFHIPTVTNWATV